MEFGVSMFCTDLSADPAEVARTVEEYGFESFWISEHSHMPLSTDFPLAASVPRVYSSMYDPFVAMTAAAMATHRLKIGSAIVILPQHDPFNCAKAIASIDRLSGGRVLFGIGAGWNEPEMRNHGTDPSTRFKLMRERVEAMKALWREEEAEYHGELVDFEPVWQWPKPLQQPHPPVIVAGAGPNILKRVVRYGDGWLPIVIAEETEASRGRMTSLAELEEMAPALFRMAEEAGRPRPEITASIMAADGAFVERLEALGVGRCILRMDSGTMDDVVRQLDAHRKAVDALDSVTA